jgi:micrococcal nuclease
VYDYKGEVLRVVDGDTVHLELDLGMDIKIRVTARLAGINAPEMNTGEGEEAKAYLQALLRPEPGAYPLPVRVVTVKDKKEKYGRYLAHLWHWNAKVDGPSINQQMVSAGHAVNVVYLHAGPRP